MVDFSKIDLMQLRAACCTDDGRLSEPQIANLLIESSGMVSLHGTPYGADGEISESELTKPLAELLSALGQHSGVANKVLAIKRLAVQLSAVESIPLKKNEIPFTNGTVTIHEDGSHSFSTEKHPAPYRLACEYDANAKDLTWFKYWMNILYEDDWACFQEIMGYLLLPVTYGQYAFFLLGAGGCGKSVWGCILRKIFGGAMTTANTHDIEEDRFTRATLENKLVNYDDDLNGAAMKKTNLFKTLVTAKQPIQGERKGQDKFEFFPYARLCACGNFALTSMHDTSDAFIRRLLPIRVKDPIEASEVIPNIEERIYPETSAIVNWALEGLKRLIQNNYRFSISERTKNLVQEIREDSNSILPFIDDMLDFNPGYRMTTTDLTKAYTNYCVAQKKTARGPKTVVSYFKDNADRLGLRYTKHCVGDARGFIGMKLKSDKSQKPSMDLDKLFSGG